MVPYVISGIVLLAMGLITKLVNVNTNYFFGYRTSRSMKNKLNWEFANKRMTNYSIFIGMLSLLAGMLFWYLDIASQTIIYLTMGLLIVSLILTEIQLYKFDKANQEKNNQ